MIDLDPAMHLSANDRLLLLGPPGTGKTTAILGIVDHLMAQGWQESDFAIVSFTRAAVKELRDRLDAIRPGRWDGVTTIHSAATRLSGANNFMDEDDWKDFNALANMTLTPEKDADADKCAERPTATEDDRVRMTYNYARNKMISLEEARVHNGSQFSKSRLQRFADLLSQYKREHDKIDFTDVIAMAKDNTIAIQRQVLIVDESQDLSPLQIAFLLPTVESASIVVVAGDDDQAIFEFQGASPAWLTSLHAAPGWRTHVLAKSWRCPEAVRLLAMRVISATSGRVDKTYTSNGRDGSVRWQPIFDALEDHCDDPADSVFVLCRGGKQCSVVTGYLFRMGVPYIVERGGGLRPYGQAKLLNALAVFEALGAGKSAPAQDAFVAIEEFCRSAKSKTDTDGVAFMPWGVKAKLKKFAETNLELTNADLIAFGCGDFVDACREYPFSVFQKEADPAVLRYLSRLIETYGELPVPKVTITTWHTSKGREAHTVIVWSEIPRPCADALYDTRHSGAEIRSAYVAVTRAREDLILCYATPGKAAYPFPR